MSKVYIVDVDGTLYSQRKMRLIIGINVLFRLILHPSEIRNIIAVFEFRRYREQIRTIGKSLEEQYSVVGERMHMDTDRVRRVVYYWMHKFPLCCLKKCAYDDFINWLNVQRDKGAKVYIYSDYPAKDKIEVLGVHYDAIYTSEEIGYVKPDKRAMEYVMNKIGYSHDDVWYIGDRDEVDGKAARSVGIHYIDIRRIREYEKIET